MRFRVIATLAVLVAAVGVLAAGVSSASAGNYEPGYNYKADPETTNIPWLAWAGETVKVSRCFGLGDSQVTQDNFKASSYNHGSPIVGTFQKVDWSGATDQPPVIETPGGTDTKITVQPNFDLPGGGVCFSADVLSDKAGLEKIKFSLDTDFSKWLINAIFGQDVIFQQDLYVIWMWDSAPTLTESGDVGAYAVGDPAGSGKFDPIADSNGYKTLQPGLIEATVQGTFPLGNDYAGLNHPTVTLPTDWLWLAQHFAEDYTLGSTYPGNPAAVLRWDIHDDTTAAEKHIVGSGCTDQIGTAESVDNCQGSGPDPDLGPFSSIFGLVGTYNDAWGPFDPLRSTETLLSDGVVNADDAPMPALRVDVSLTNAGADHSVGTLSKADKSAIFNRNDPTYGGNTTDLGDPHMLYAPFYKAYIPAVLPIFDLGSTSGVEGSISGNFPEWLTSGLYNTPTTDTYLPGGYDYWDTFTLDSTNAMGTPYNGCNGADGNGISQPDGNTSVAVYTDEHGQAYVQFNAANNGASDYTTWDSESHSWVEHQTIDDGEGIVLTPDNNGLCDVYTGSLVGTATIQAEAVYPAEDPSDPSNMGTAKTSNILTKTVDFTPSKTINCVEKNLAQKNAFCVETVTDFEGNPLEGAKVEFSAQAAQGASPSFGADSAVVGPYDTTGQGGPDVNSGPAYAGGFIDLTTNAKGEAGIYIHSTTNACIDVTAENVGTRYNGAGIFRDTDFNPTTGTACSTGGADNSGNPPAGGGTPPAGGNNSGSTPQAATPVVLQSVTAPAPTVQAPAASNPKTAKTVKVTLVSAHVVSTRTGRFLTVRVNSNAKTATLRITLVSKNGAKHIVLRTVATNHVVRITNLKLAPSVKTVRVAVA